MRKYRFYILLFIFLSSCLFLAQKIAFYKIRNKENSYARLIKTYKEWLSSEETTSKQLSFKLSPEQPTNKGQRAKLILEDATGRKWMFKPDYLEEEKFKPFAKGKNSLTAYRIYRLFNVQSPRTFFITLNINNKQISGSLQEFIAAKSTLSKFPPSQISPQALDYILKTNVLDWLIANHNSSALHFLVLTTDNYGKPNELSRVDNDAAFMLLGKDKLRADWIAPWDINPTLYYHWLWKDYILDKIKIDLPGNIPFIKFISEFPDTFFKEIIQLELKNSTPDNKHLKYILSRKLNLVKDFKEFYSSLAKAKNAALEFNTNAYCRKLAASAVKNLTNEIKKLKEENLTMQNLPKLAPQIEAIFSFEGFQLLAKVYDAYWLEENNLTPICADAMEKLYLLIANTENKHEKQALQLYMREVKKIYQGETPSFPRDKINKVADQLTPAD